MSFVALSSISRSAPSRELARFVRKNEGQMTLTSTPKGESSWESVSLTATTAAFVALYVAMAGA